MQSHRTLCMSWIKGALSQYKHMRCFFRHYAWARFPVCISGTGLIMNKWYLQANGEDSDSDYDDEAEETALESYNTPLDADECNIDEYQVFINAMKGRLSSPQCRELGWIRRGVSVFSRPPLPMTLNWIGLSGFVDQNRHARSSKGWCTQIPRGTVVNNQN